MIVTTSNRRFGTVIRGLEGLDDSVTDAEIGENSFRHGQRLGEYLRNFGLAVVGAGQMRAGEIVDLQVALNTTDREDIVKGLRVLQPLNITAEYGDIPYLWINNIVRACIQDNWQVAASMLTKVQPEELPQLLFDIELKICFPANPSPDQQIETELSYENWLTLHGLKDPMAGWNAYDREKQRQIDAEEARKKAQYEHLWGDSRV